MFLSENSVVLQMNDRRLKKNELVCNIGVNFSVRNFWALCVVLRIKTKVNCKDLSREFTLQTILLYTSEIYV